jgi:peptidoglycan-associated lipoprotein
MEVTMIQSLKTFRMAVAILTLTFAAGCAQQPTASAPRPVHDAATSGPELAGAWYQIYFDTSSISINTRGQMIVKNVAYVIAHGGPARVTVIGRTDRVGSALDNLALSARRANAVRDALIVAGVPESSIDTSWVGESGQASAADEAVNPRNLAVDVTVIKEPQSSK